MWKAFAELEAIGFIGSKRPRMVAVQAAGCAPMVRAFENGTEHAPRWEDAHTIASGIRVPQAIGDFLILRAVRESKGFAIAVTDEKISAALSEVAREEGLLLCPEGAATYAAYKQSLDDGRVTKNDRVMLFNCATGLKYPLPPVTFSTRSASPSVTFMRSAIIRAMASDGPPAENGTTMVMGCDGKVSANALPPNASIAINAAQIVLRITSSNAA